MIKFVCFTVLSGVLAGCAVVKTPVATGGSRADGTIHMSYDVGGLEKPQIDWASTKERAAQRCRVWGYTDADPFGGVTTKCQAYNRYGCIRATVTRTYQCTGKN
jgi:hypothetical protein